MGLLDKVVAPIRNLFAKPTQQGFTSYKTFTEYSPGFASWEGQLYEQAQIRAIVERIASACSKLKPEFVTPDGSNGSVPRLQRLVSSWPNDMMSWPAFLKRVATFYYVDTTAFIVPGYDMDGNVSSFWPLRPSYTELIEYEGEPWLRFHLRNGDIQAFPFYDVVILTRFQLESDIFGGGNAPLTPTLRLMDAQRQAEEIALKTGADIRFIGKLSGMVHERDMNAKRDRFAQSNLNPAVNKSSLMVFDQTFEDIKQIKSEHYTIDPEEMERIDKALYAYFGINENILHNDYDEAQWSAFYEGVVEPFAIQLAEGLNIRYLTPTQRRKGNGFMFSSSYLEYATTDSKIKVANMFLTAGVGMRNEVRDIFQLPHVPGGDAFMIRGEYYMVDVDNNIIAESGGHGDHSVTYVDDLTDIDEPDDDSDDMDDLTRALNAKVSQMIERRLKRLEP